MKKLLTVLLFVVLLAAIFIPRQITEESRGADWLVVGPFPAGALDVLTDDLYEHGGAAAIEPEEGMKLASKAAVAYAGSGYPDFIVFGKSVETKGWGGFRAAGFFGNDWKISDDSRLTFVKA